MEVVLEIISKELIKPSSPTPHDKRNHNLSLMDQLIHPCFIPLIFFYQNPLSSDDPAKITRNLTQSFSDALTKFYPLAGRIKGNLLVDCNDSGALFVEARILSPLSKSRQNASNVDVLNQFLPFDPYSGTNADSPVLAVQINSFECGGTAIGVCMSHKVGDQMSLVTFMNSWAAINREEADEVAEPNFNLASELFPPVDEGSPFPSYGGTGVESKFVTKKFLFSKEKLSALKQLVSSASGSMVTDPTRVEAVSAFIWKQFIDISRAKANINTTRTTIFAAHLAVNLRSRMNLPIQNFTFGNFLTAASASMIFSDNQDGIEECSVGDLVSKLRVAIRNACEDDHIRNLQSAISHLNSLNEAIKFLSKKEMESCMISSWCRFSFYEVDYGFGKPVSVCTSAAPSKNLVYLITAKDGEGIEAWINMLEDEMGMLHVELLELESESLLG